MQNTYAQSRSKRKETMDNSGKMRGGTLTPVSILALRSNESAVLQQSVQVELEPVVGRLVTNVSARVTAVYVPIRAIDAFVNVNNDHSGNAEILRERMLNKEMIFPMEPETAISRILNVVPKSVNGNKVLNSVTRHSHNVAVNFLRKKKYTYAEQIGVDNVDVTPAIIKFSVLDHFNGVLDPDEHVNGAVTLEGEVPIRGLALRNFNIGDNPRTFSTKANKRIGDNAIDGWSVNGDPDSDISGSSAALVVEEDTENPGYPDIRADFGLAEGQELSLKQFYLAEKQDKLARTLRTIVDNNPEYGEEIISRMVHGLEIDSGKMPYVLYDKTVFLNRGIKSAMDGPSLDVQNTNVYGEVGFTVPIAKNEFGGVVMVFLEIKPDEVIPSQPHPVLSEPWEIENHVADEMELDPVPVTLRELDSDVSPADEGTVAMYVGHNHMRRQYVRAGFTRDTDLTTVEHKSALWQYGLPLSVNPQNILYPADLEHYPFALNGPDDQAVSYRAVTQSMINSPMILGPTPIERLAILDDKDIFGVEDEDE